MALFSAKDLEDFLGYTVDEAQAAMAEKVVAGWLAEEGLTYADGVTVPTVLPPQIFSWALELGAIYHENPTSQVSDQTAGQMQSWSTLRRNEILSAVRRYAQRIGVSPDPVGAAPAPLGRFPRPNPIGRW